MPHPAIVLPRDLGDGLMLRVATGSDTEALADFNGRMHKAPYDTVAEVWTRELLRGDHPTGAHDRVLLVEDRASGAIASTTMLIPQTWSYDGIPIPAGRPELVATDPAFRRRGLVREQFATLHAWGEAAGQDLQFITGIPNYYRQFGYEPAIGIGNIDAPAHRIRAITVPDGTGYRFRPITPEDIPLVARFDAQVAARSRLNVERDETLWRYELFARDRGSDFVQSGEVLEDEQGGAAGILFYTHWRRGGEVEALWCEVAPGRSWRTVGARLLRRLQEIGEQQEEEYGPWTGVAVVGGAGHPLMEAFPDLFVPRRRPFVLYVRIPDYVRFLRRIAPVLERRIAESPLVGYDELLRINLYRSGLAMTFAGGRVTTVEPWHPTQESAGEAAFPGLTLSQLILGARSLGDLEYAFDDCAVASDEVSALVTTLFPRQDSTPWPVG